MFIFITISVFSYSYIKIKKVQKFTVQTQLHLCANQLHVSAIYNYYTMLTLYYNSSYLGSILSLMTAIHRRNM